jgi:hypothetical protein
MRDYGLTNAAPSDFAPAVGPQGSTYYHNFTKGLYLSDGSLWNPIYQQPMTGRWFYDGYGGSSPAAGHWRFTTLPLSGVTNTIEMNVTEIDGFNKTNAFVTLVQGDQIVMQWLTGEVAQFEVLGPIAVAAGVYSIPVLQLAATAFGATASICTVNFVPTPILPGVMSRYKWGGLIGTASPNAGEIASDANGLSATVLKFHQTDLDNITRNASFFNLCGNHDQIIVTSGSKNIVYMVTGPAVTVGSTYEVPIVYRRSTGGFTAGDICTVTLIASGIWYTAWGQVGYCAQLQPNTQALTSAGGVTDMTGMSLTWTAIPGRLYKETAIAHFVKDATAGDLLIRTADGASVELQRERRAAGANGDVTLNILAYETFGSIGSITRKLRAQTVTGSATIQCASALTGSMLSTFIIEDAGPA